jgi:hypothetical protein
MMSSAAGAENIPAIAKAFPGSGENRSPSRRNPFRGQPGILFSFTAESFSRSPWNPVRLAPESAL